MAKRLNTQSPEAAMVGVCLSLLRKSNQIHPPIALRSLAELLGVHFKWSGDSYSDGRGTASLESVQGGFRIVMHERDFQRNWRRARFTLAHELAHILVAKVLDNGALIEELSHTDDNHRQLERLCDIGAAEILMPRPQFRRDLASTSLSPEQLLKLYDRYMVSREALIWRIGETIPRGAVVRWRHSEKPDDEGKLRVVSSYPPYSESIVRPWLPRGASTRHAPQIPGGVYESELWHELPELEVSLNKRTWSGSGILARWPRRKDPQPVLSGFTVPDEPASTWYSDILLFAGERDYLFPSLPNVAVG